MKICPSSQLDNSLPMSLLCTGIPTSFSFNISKVLKNFPGQGPVQPENKCLSCQNSCFQPQLKPFSICRKTGGEKETKGPVPCSCPWNKCLRGEQPKLQVSTVITAKSDQPPWLLSIGSTGMVGASKMCNIQNLAPGSSLKPPWFCEWGQRWWGNIELLTQNQPWPFTTKMLNFNTGYSQKWSHFPSFFHENLSQIVLHVGADNEFFLSQQNLLKFLH